MEVNMKGLEDLLKTVFHGNQTAFAEATGINRTHVNKVFKSNGRGAGATFCGAIMKYCINNNLDYNKYIFFS